MEKRTAGTCGVCLFCFLKPQVIMPEKTKCSILFLAYLWKKVNEKATL